MGVVHSSCPVLPGSGLVVFPTVFPPLDKNLKLNHFHYIQLINGSSVEILIQKRRSNTQLSLAYTCLSEMLQNHPEIS